MQVTETLSEGLKRGFTVVLPAAEIEGKRAKRLAELSRDLRLPGFRPGKVPQNLVRKRFGPAVNAEILEESVSSATQQLLSDRGLRSAGQPKIELASIEEARDLEFKLEVELLPDIAMPDFSALKLTRMRSEVSDETVDRALGEIIRRQRTLEPVDEDRPAERGDIAVLDYAGAVDGQPFSGGTGTDMELEVAGAGFIPGFSEQIAGMRAGETRTVRASFPAGYGVAELAGKEATFEVTVKALKRAVLPEANDALAETLGFDNLAELRRLLSNQAQREYDQLARLRLKRQLLDALSAEARFPVPDGMVDAEFEQIWQRIEADRKEGRLDDEDRAKDEESLRREYRAIAERRVRLGLLLAEVGRSNGISVGNDEMLRAMRAEAARYPGQEQQVMELFRKNPQAAETLRGPLFEDKVVDYIIELAEVTDRTVAPEELAREEPAPGELAPGRPDPADEAAAAPAAAAPADEAAPGHMPGAEN
jgi:trigger factor